MERPVDEHATRLLVVEDEPSIAEALTTSLRFRGFHVRTAPNGSIALRLVAEERPELILLDVLLPDTDGFSLLRRLREAGVDVPVIFLTARDSHQDRIRGLTVGADDYVTKPFALDEVVARVRAVLRRSRGSNPAQPEVLQVGDLVLDQGSYRVHRADVEIALSPTEFRLLRYLMANAGQVVTRQQVLDNVWDYDFAGDDTVVATYVAYLRRKIDALGDPLIHTQRGVGYSLRER